MSDILWGLSSYMFIILICILLWDEVTDFTVFIAESQQIILLIFYDNYDFLNCIVSFIIFLA